MVSLDCEKVRELAHAASDFKDFVLRAFAESYGKEWHPFIFTGRKPARPNFEGMHDALERDLQDVLPCTQMYGSGGDDERKAKGQAVRDRIIGKRNAEIKRANAALTSNRHRWTGLAEEIAAWDAKAFSVLQGTLLEGLQELQSEEYVSLLRSDTYFETVVDMLRTKRDQVARDRMEYENAVTNITNLREALGLKVE